MFEHDVVFGVSGIFLDPLPTAIEEVRHAGVELDFRATLTKDAVVEARHVAG